MVPSGRREARRLFDPGQRVLRIEQVVVAACDMLPHRGLRGLRVAPGERVDHAPVLEIAQALRLFVRIQAVEAHEEEDVEV